MKFFLNRHSPTITVERLKRYGYSAAIALGLLSASLVLLFGSPTFSLSPATVTFDYVVYPVLIVLGIFLIRAILTGRIAIHKFEKPMVAFGALFFVSKYSLTVLTAPTLLPLKFTESWYWMMIGVWTIAFLAYDFYEAIFINLSVYTAQVAVTVTNTWLKATPDALLDLLSDIAASNLRLGTTLAFLFILGYIKHQWVSVEQEAMLLRKIAHIDLLTELPNRRLLSDALSAAVADARGPVSVILFDLDGFKQVNDEFGHNAGDEVLRRIAQLAQTCMRSDDTLGRWGGEEFLIVCPNTKLMEGVRLAERLRQTFADDDASHGRSITASFGVAERRADESVDQLVARADAALYAAKARGKNQVQAAVSSTA